MKISAPTFFARAPMVLIALSLLPLPAPAQEVVTTLAGTPLTSGTNSGSAGASLFNDPTGLALDAAGNLYIADNQNHAIRKLSTNGIVSTFAGKIGQPGSTNGTGTNALFYNPSGVAFAPNGTLYVTDTGNDTIRAIATNGAVSTLAGSPGQNGATNAAGSLARFDTPLGIAVDAAGTIYVADCANHLIRKVTPTGVVTTLAGSPGVWGTNDGVGTNALFNGPVGIALDDKTNLFVSDSNNHTIRKITPSGGVTTWAGTPGVDGTTNGTGNAALFRKPGDLKMDRNGNLFVMDSFNHTLRCITSNGVVTTIAGLAGNGGSVDGLGDQARFFNPFGLAVDHNGNLRVSDTYNQTIRFAYAPIIASLVRQNSAGSTLISWSAIVGDIYQLQFKDSLNSSWQILGSSVTATNSAMVVLDGSAPGSGRFYRVELLP